MSEKNNLHIHARITPEADNDFKKPKLKSNESNRIARNRKAIDKRMTFSDRLLRNSTIACALLLGILALGNIDQPWAKKVSQGVQKALTMQINLDETIGELSFVRDIMPESALVFLNISNDAEIATPVSGSLTHPWSETQPWIMFDCPNGTQVHAAQSGVVTAISELSDGKTGILIDHGNGIESVYAYLDSSIVQPGDTIEKEQQIGTASNPVF